MNVRQKWDVKYMLVCFMGTNDVCHAVCCWCVCFCMCLCALLPKFCQIRNNLKLFLMVPIIVELLDDV